MQKCWTVFQQEITEKWAQKVGVALPRPFGSSAMLDKITKNSLD